MAGLEAQKRPLMLAALNGLSVARVSGREESRADGSRIPMDERVSGGLVSHARPSLRPQESRARSLPGRARAKSGVGNSFCRVRRARPGLTGLH